MAEDNYPRWYAIRTATRQESKAVTSLLEMRQEHNLIAQFYLPCERRWGPYKRDGKTREAKVSPLLVGYLFVWMGRKTSGTRRSCPGSIGSWTTPAMDGRASRPRSPAYFIDKLKEAEDAGKFDRTQGKSRAKGVERVAWKKLADLATMTEDERLRALASYLGLKIEPEAEPEPDYSAAMAERKAA
jgi:hypothetical protein